MNAMPIFDNKLPYFVSTLHFIIDNHLGHMPILIIKFSLFYLIYAHGIGFADAHGG